MKTNCGAMGAGAGGGNRVASDHISDQHVQADAMSMIGTAKQSLSSVSSNVKPKNAPSTAGSPTAGAKPGKRTFKRPLD